MILLSTEIVMELFLSTEVVKISASSLIICVGNITGFGDIFFDGNTRKRLIKEAEYYQLEGMKNILAFKPNSVNKEDDGDGKAEIIEIVENVIQNKEAIRNILDESRSNRRSVPSEGSLTRTGELERTQFFDFAEKTETKTSAPKTFENEIGDGQNLERTSYQHNITFKQCSFVNANFNYCEFKENTIVSFDRCDLLIRVFSMPISTAKSI